LADTDLQIEALNKKLKKQEDMAQKGLMAQGAVAKIQKEIDVLLKNKFQKENSILRLSENEEAFEKLKQELAEKRKAVFKQRSDRFSAEIKALEKQAETGSSIVSPVNGQIADIKVNAGDIVSPDACLMTIERQ
jgi:biotin carboxyl carrier protein